MSDSDSEYEFEKLSADSIPKSLSPEAPPPQNNSVQAPSSVVVEEERAPVENEPAKSLHEKDEADDRSLLATIKSLEEHNITLQQENDGLEVQLAETKNANADHEQMKKFQAEEIQKLNQVITALENKAVDQNSALLNHITELEKELHEVKNNTSTQLDTVQEDAAERLTTLKEAYQKELDTLKRAYEANRKKLDETEEIIEEHIDDIAKLKNALSQAQQALEERRDQTDKVEDLLARHEAQEREAVIVAAKLSRADFNAAEWANRERQLLAEIKNLEDIVAEHSNLQALAAKREAKLNQTQEMLERTLKALEERDVELHQIHAELDLESSKRSDLEKALNERDVADTRKTSALKGREAQLLRELEEVNAKISDQEQGLKQRDAEIARMKNSATQLGAAQQQRDRELEKASKGLALEQKTNAELQNAVKELRSNEAQKNREFAERERKLQVEICTLKERVAGAAAGGNAHQAELRQLQAALREKEELMRHLSESLNEYVQDHQNQREMTDFWRNQYREQEEIIRGLTGGQARPRAHPRQN